jgi:hypothetical protein
MEDDLPLEKYKIYCNFNDNIGYINNIKFYLISNFLFSN